MGVSRSLFALAVGCALLWAAPASAAPIDAAASSMAITTGCAGSPFGCDLGGSNASAIGGEIDPNSGSVSFELRALSDLTLDSGNVFSGMQMAGSMSDVGGVWSGNVTVSGLLDGTAFSTDVAVTGACDAGGCDVLLNRFAFSAPLDGTRGYFGAAARIVAASSPIPEPGAATLFMLGAVLVGGAVRRPL